MRWYAVQGCPYGLAGAYPVCFPGAPMDAGDMQPCGLAELLPARTALHNRGIHQRVPRARAMDPYEAGRWPCSQSRTAPGLLWQ